MACLFVDVTFIDYLALNMYIVLSLQPVIIGTFLAAAASMSFDVDT
jgi:hypothetical protein